MIFTRGLRVCLAAQPADLRRSFEGLAIVVRQALKEDERSSQIFVFINKRRDRIRLLYWDGTGLWQPTAGRQTKSNDEKIGVREFLVADGAGGEREDSAEGGGFGNVIKRD